MSSTSGTWAEDVRKGERFEFGRNWTAFLHGLNEERIRRAEASLCEFLGQERLDGLSFCDVGQGSGLFSLASRRLGARVHSFDFDPRSVACAVELKRRFFPEDPAWTVAEGSALDEAYLDGLGSFDIVYSWGVLHHTGEMWRALANVDRLVAPDGGRLFLAIYNDQERISHLWTRIKKLYCRSLAGRTAARVLVYPYFALLTGLAGLAETGNPFARFRASLDRGMSPVVDWEDWLGGYPFEVARPEEIHAFYRARGYGLERLRTTNRKGCNEFVFRKLGRSTADRAHS